MRGVVVPRPTGTDLTLSDLVRVVHSEDGNRITGFMHFHMDGGDCPQSRQRTGLPATR
jgi:hypothetical protein